MQFILKLTRKLYKSGGRKFDVEATFATTIWDTILGRNLSNTLLKDWSGVISGEITGVEASEKLNCLFWYFIQKSSRPHSIQITLNYRFIKIKIKIKIKIRKKKKKKRVGQWCFWANWSKILKAVQNCIRWRRLGMSHVYKIW